MGDGTVDPADLTLAAAARLLAARSLSAVELLAAVLDRLDRTEPHVHAYAHVDREGALAAARRADAELAARRRGAAVTPLHGIPLGVKDVLPVEGLPLTGGSPAFAGNVAPRDAEAVRRLRAAGAVIVGMHVTHELATGQNVPPTRNAWELSHYPGGSTAGGGVSVAVGSSLGAIGTDAGGSVRKPAALNNLTGLKPTRGLVPRDGVLQPSGTLDHVGTVARTVEDTAHLLGVLAGTASAGPDGSAADASRPGGLRGARIGIDRAAFFGETLDDAVRPALDAALAELVRQGATLVPVALPRIRDLAIPVAFCILTGEAGASRGRLAAERPEALGEGARLMIELGTLLPARWTDASQRARTLMRREAEAAFATERLDLLVTPTMPITSLPLAEMEARTDLARTVLCTAAWNLTGQPALTVPCGFSPGGLPVGLQLVGRPYGEAALLAAGAAYQAATDWHERRPPLLAGLAAGSPA